jgi:heme/copper-type cytochrome/quinol oxidase subunit 2
MCSASHRSNLSNLLDVELFISIVTSSLVILKVVMETNLNQTARNFNSQQSKSLRILKILVIVMGVMIVVGLFIVIFTITNRIMEKSSKITNIPWVITTAIDRGSAIESMAADKERLFINVKSLTGMNSVLIFDSENGNKLGALEFKPKK